jgi:putative RNA 2'-phosphotransferase
MNKLKGDYMDYIKLSKTISRALRHAPKEYGLILDDEGYVKIDDLISSLHKINKWKSVNLDHLYKVIEKTDKKRFEITNGKIKAYYGHSIDKIIKKEVKEPPEFLIHGTARANIDSIKDIGLIPGRRQYVHLSLDKETALKVGRRHDKNPILLKVKSLEAFKNGVNFYYGNEDIWLSDKIPAKFIEFN